MRGRAAGSATTAFDATRHSDVEHDRILISLAALALIGLAEGSYRSWRLALDTPQPDPPFKLPPSPWEPPLPNAVHGAMIGARQLRREGAAQGEPWLRQQAAQWVQDSAAQLRAAGATDQLLDHALVPGWKQISPDAPGINGVRDADQLLADGIERLDELRARIGRHPKLRRRRAD